MKKFKIDRIISLATLLASLVAIFFVLKKPSPVAVPQAPSAIAVHAQSFDRKMAQFDQAAQQSQARGSENVATASLSSASTSNAEVHLNSEEVSAVLAQSLGTAGTAGLTPESNVGSGAPTIKDQRVTFEGDVVRGQFLTEVAG